MKLHSSYVRALELRAIIYGKHLELYEESLADFDSAISLDNTNENLVYERAKLKNKHL